VVLIVIARGGVAQIADFDAVTEFSLYRKHRGRDLFETLVWEYAEQAACCEDDDDQLLRGRQATR
jgi:hypothetical protein